jgi:hypothetical protein
LVGAIYSPAQMLSNTPVFHAQGFQCAPGVCFADIDGIFLAIREVTYIHFIVSASRLINLIFTKSIKQS